MVAIVSSFVLLCSSMQAVTAVDELLEELVIGGEIELSDSRLSKSSTPSLGRLLNVSLSCREVLMLSDLSEVLVSFDSSSSSFSVDLQPGFFLSLSIPCSSRFLYKRGEVQMIKAS